MKSMLSFNTVILIVNSVVLVCQSFRSDLPRTTCPISFCGRGYRVGCIGWTSYAVVVTGSDYDDVPVEADFKRKSKLSRLLGRRMNSASGQSASTDLPIKGVARDDKSSVIDEQQQQADEDITATAVDQELDESYRKDKLEYDKLFSAKLDEWKELKRLGLLDKLSGTVYEEDVFELDEEVSKRRLRRLRQRPHNIDRGDGQLAEDSTVEEASSVVMGVHELRAKYLSTKNSSLGLYSLLNEMKDKSLIESMPLSSNGAVHEEDAIDIMEQIMMSIARLDSPHHPVSALKLYLGYLQRGSIAPDRVDPLFLPRYVLQLYTSNLLSAADQCRDLLRHSPVVDADCVSDSRLLTGYICASIHQLASQLLTTNKNKADKLQLEQHLLSTIEEQLQQLSDELRAYPLSEINAVLRVLAKYKLIDRIFSLLGEMRARGVRPNSESLEFLANALVGSVEKGRTASSMRDLPEPMAEVPEIVFVGRSNVGKSSLVNCVLNRKALASTSSVPGHTKLFHFFAVNADHPTLPAFRLVDVPGIGYAETVDDDKKQSWNSLLQRYLARREPLRLVCHLVDSRHKVTPADRQMFEIMLRASSERYSSGIDGFSYAIVMTKSDKTSGKVLQASIHDVRKTVADIAQRLVVDNPGYPVPVISSDDDAIHIGSDDDEEKEEAEEEDPDGTMVSRSVGLQEHLRHMLSCVEVLSTSSVSKEGADDVWRVIQKAVFRK